MAKQLSGLRLHQIILEVKDVNRSRQFYTKKLGFKVKHDYAPEYLAVETPNRLQIGFYPRKSRGVKRGRRDQPVGIEFDVADVDALYRRLRKMGVKFTEKPTNAWGEREARFLD